MKYELPPEPEGPVWDFEGRRHERDRNGLWSVGTGSWGELLAAYAPLADENPNKDHRGRLTLVETKDRRQYVVVPLWDEEHLFVVLPNERSGDVIDAESVVSATPLAALPSEHVGDYERAVKWLDNSKSLQSATASTPKWGVAGAAD